MKDEFLNEEFFLQKNVDLYLALKMIRVVLDNTDDIKVIRTEIEKILDAQGIES